MPLEHSLDALVSLVFVVLLDVYLCPTSDVRYLSISSQKMHSSLSYSN